MLHKLFAIFIDKHEGWLAQLEKKMWSKLSTLDKSLQLKNKKNLKLERKKLLTKVEWDEWWRKITKKTLLITRENEKSINWSAL